MMEPSNVISFGRKLDIVSQMQDDANYKNRFPVCRQMYKELLSQAETPEETSAVFFQYIAFLLYYAQNYEDALRQAVCLDTLCHKHRKAFSQMELANVNVILSQCMLLHKNYDKDFLSKIKELCYHALADYEEVEEESPNNIFLSVSKIHKMLGDAFRQGGKIIPAGRHYKTAIRILEDGLSVNAIKDRVLSDLAENYLAYADFCVLCRKEYEEGDYFHEQGFTIQKALAERKPEDPEAQSNYAAACLRKAEFYRKADEKKAKASFQKAMEITDKLLKKDPERYRFQRADACYRYGCFLSDSDSDKESLLEEAAMIANEIALTEFSLSHHNRCAEMLETYAELLYMETVGDRTIIDPFSEATIFYDQAIERLRSIALLSPEEFGKPYIQMLLRVQDKMEPLTQFRFERAIEWKQEVEKYGITPNIEELQQICLYLIEKNTASAETEKVQDMQEEYLRCQNAMKNDVEVQI